MRYEKMYLRLRRRCVLFPLVLLTASAPGDREAMIRLLAAQDAAVIVVGERLSVAARALCPSGGWATGLVLQALTQYGPAYRSSARNVLSLGEYPTITFVTPNGAAHAAGLVPGDEILAVDSVALPKTIASGAARMTDSTRALDAIDAALSDGEARLQVLRGATPLRITLRARLQASPLMDEKGFTRDLENLFRQMWRSYCNQGA